MSGGLFGARIPRRAKTIRLRHGLRDGLRYGKKRAITLSAASNQAGAEKVRQGPGGSATGSRVAYFEFAGGRARMVIGGSGCRYFFAVNGRWWLWMHVTAAWCHECLGCGKCGCRSAFSLW